MHQHVDGIHCGHVQAEAGGHDKRKAQRADHKPRGASLVPAQPALVHAVNAVAICRGQEQANRAKHDVKAEHRPDIEYRGRLMQVIAHEDLHGAQVRIPRWRRHGAPQGDGYANRARHDRELHDGDADKEPRVFI